MFPFPPNTLMPAKDLLRDTQIHRHRQWQLAALVLLILILLFLTDLAVLVLFSFRIPSLRMRERTVLG